MPTKVPEPCPRCGAATLPTDRSIAWDTEFGPVPWRQWRYECDPCAWSWTNAAQRAHNVHEYDKLRRRLSARGWE